MGNTEQTFNFSFQVNGNADIESLLSDLDCSSERMQAQEAPNGGGEEGGDLYSYRRGDIPIFNFDEADRVLVSKINRRLSRCSTARGSRSLVLTGWSH